jgi:hypothetical protein
MTNLAVSPPEDTGSGTIPGVAITSSESESGYAHNLFSK